MSSRKEKLITKIVREIVLGILKDLVISDTDAPKDILNKIRELGDVQDYEKIIELLPKKLQNKYKDISVTIKNQTEIGILKYDVSL